MATVAYVWEVKRSKHAFELTEASFPSPQGAVYGKGTLIHWARPNHKGLVIWNSPCLSPLHVNIFPKWKNLVCTEVFAVLTLNLNFTALSHFKFSQTRYIKPLQIRSLLCIFFIMILSNQNCPASSVVRFSRWLQSYNFLEPMLCIMHYKNQKQSECVLLGSLHPQQNSAWLFRSVPGEVKFHSQMWISTNHLMVAFNI